MLRGSSSETSKPAAPWRTKTENLAKRRDKRNMQKRSVPVRTRSLYACDPLIGRTGVAGIGG